MRWGKGISEVLTFAVGVAISPVPIIAVTLMLFSQRARVNGLMFLLGWVVALAVVSGVAYAAADQANAATDSTTSDTIAWGRIVFGVLFLLLAARNWRTRPAPGTEPEMPKWMAGIDATETRQGAWSGPSAGGSEPEEPDARGRRRRGAGRPWALDRRRGRLAGRVRSHRQPHDRRPCRLLPAGRRDAKARLDEMKTWLAVHNNAVMAVLFLVFGAKLIADGLPPLT